MSKTLDGVFYVWQLVYRYSACNGKLKHLLCDSVVHACPAMLVEPVYIVRVVVYDIIVTALTFSVL